MSEPTKTRRVCAGLYEVRKGAEVAVIDHRPDIGGWVASLNSDPHVVSDPLPTKRDAVSAAHEMLSSLERGEYHDRR